MLRKAAYLGIIVLLFQILFTPLKVYAVALSNAEVRFYRMQVSTAANTTTARILVKLTPSTAASENEIRVTFDPNYTVDSTNTNITVSTTGLPTECTAAPGIGSNANAVSGQQVDFTVTNLAQSTTYCFFITGGITNPGSAGQQEIDIYTLSGSNVIEEEMQIATYTLTSDQVVVSATVPATFTFSLSQNNAQFNSNLSTGSIVSTVGVSGTVTTNAGQGWTAFLRSANAGLDSAVSGDTIDTSGSIDNSPTTLTVGQEFYQLDVDETTDPQTNGSIDAEYDGSGTQGGTFNGTDLEAIASGTGASAGYVFTLLGKATISGVTEAADDYTDTWTVVASGNF